MRIIIEVAENEAHPSVAVDSGIRSLDGGVFSAPEPDANLLTSRSTEDIVVDAGPAGQLQELDAKVSDTKDDNLKKLGEGE